MFAGTYDGKTLEDKCNNRRLNRPTKRIFRNRHDLRHVLVTTVDNAKTCARWNNNLQAYTENLGLGIPVNISTDPRHGASADTEFNVGAGGDISKWPECLGLGATFDEKIVKKVWTNSI